MTALFLPGTIFLDFKASNITGQKPKYFIGMNEANDKEDKIVCFVFNTEHKPEMLTPGCNKDKEKFFIPFKKFNFQTEHTSIMLYRAVFYTLEELLNEDKIKVLETIDDITSRQVKNCIDKDSIEPFAWNLINASFKIKKN